MAEKTLNDLFYETLRDIYYAERKIVKALPRMAHAANEDKLKQAFDHHREETEDHISRLEDIFEILGKPARGRTCDAINGILDEGDEVMQLFKGTAALDAGLVAAAQAVEHYEIARYGTLRTWAKRLGHDDVRALLEQTLSEESNADSKLTEIAETAANAEAEKKAA